MERAGIRWIAGVAGDDGKSLVGAAVGTGGMQVVHRGTCLLSLLRQPTTGPAWHVANAYGEAGGAGASVSAPPRLLDRRSRPRLKLDYYYYYDH